MNKVLEHDDVTIIENDSFEYQESDQSKAFEDFRQAFDQEQMGTLRVHRIPVTNKTTQAQKLRTVYLFSCPIDAFSFEELLEHIKDNYGGGTFRLIGSREGRRGHAFNRIIEIEAPKQSFKAPDVNYTGGSNPSELINQMGAVMLEHTSRIEELMRGSAQPMGDPMDQLTKMASAFGTIFGAMGIKPEKPKSIVDQLAEFAAIKDLFDKGDSGGGGSQSNIYSLLESSVKNFGPLLAAAITAQRQAGAIPPAGAIQALPAPPATAEPEPAAVDSDLEAFRPQIVFLLGQAKAGATAADVAAALVPGLADDALESIDAFLQRPDCIDICAHVEADVNEHRGWFQAWREAMLRLLDEIFAESSPSDDTLKSVADVKIDSVPDLTLIEPGVQTAAAVAGKTTEPAISADASATANDSHIDGPASGNGGDAGDSEPDAGASPPV